MARFEVVHHYMSVGTEENHDQSRHLFSGPTFEVGPLKYEAGVILT
jgi:hypothetical protein